MRAPDPELIGRFRHDLEALTGEAPSPGRMLGLGVSGGTDSMAMLLLAAAAYPGAVRAATVNHGLRPEAADEAALVGDVCAALVVPHASLPPPPGHAFTGNVQEQARELRYSLLHNWATAEEEFAPWVAVAHQRDDVGETFLMRARRGAGVRGLARMQKSRPITGRGVVLLVRPLLEWSRGELAAITQEAGILCAQDPSNTAERFDRSRIRALLGKTSELPAERLARAAENLRHAEDALEWWVEREIGYRLKTDDAGNLRLDPRNLPYELRRRLVWRAVQSVREAQGNTDAWRESGIDRLVATLDAGDSATIAGIHARVMGEKWHFRPAPPRRSL